MTATIVRSNRDSLLDRVLAGKRELGVEDWRELRDRGYGSYLNGLRLKFGGGNVLVGRDLMGYTYIAIIIELRGALRCVSVKLYGNMDIDKPVLDEFPAIEAILHTLADKGQEFAELEAVTMVQQTRTIQ